MTIKQDVAAVRSYLNIENFEVPAPKGAFKVEARCTIKGPLGSWQQAAVCGYMMVKQEVHVLALMTEKPTLPGEVPNFEIVALSRVRPFKKVVEREFRL